MSLYDRGIEAERNEARELYAAWLAAKEATAEHRREQERLQSELYRLNSTVGLSARAAFSAHLAGEKPTATVPERSKADLELLIDGAKQQIKDDVDGEARALGAVQAHTLGLLTAWTERAAQGLLVHAGHVAAAHAEIASAQMLTRSLTGDSRCDLVDLAEWDKLNVPGSQQIAALRGRGVEVNPGWHTFALAGGDPTICRKASGQALDALTADLRRLFAGEWPFKNGGGTGAVALVPAFGPPGESERSKASRRAALERAAGGSK